MLKNILLSAAFVIAAISVQAQTQVTITLDTKEMGNFSCNLNGDGVGPAPVNKVYMHSGACSENRGSNQSQSAEAYCAEQIVPFASDVWQHVVGNWGANPQDDGVGEMTDEGNGVYSSTFVIEDYYSDAGQVSTEQNSTGTTTSAPMNPSNTAYLLGLVFRNEDATATGRDESNCNDIFVINLHKANPTVINSSDNSICDFVTLTKVNTGIEDNTAISGFHFGPNPITDNARFELRMNQARANVTFEIHNTIGQLTYLDNLDLIAGKNTYELNAADLTNGIYLASFKDASGILVQERIVISK